MAQKKFYYKGDTYNPQSVATIETNGCADITFINQGTADVNIGGTLVKAGQSFTDPAFGDELNESKYSIVQITAGTVVIYYRRKFYR